MRVALVDLLEDGLDPGDVVADPEEHSGDAGTHGHVLLEGGYASAHVPASRWATWHTCQTASSARL